MRGSKQQLKRRGQFRQRRNCRSRSDSLSRRCAGNRARSPCATLFLAIAVAYLIIMSTEKLIIYTDGGARGNPGPAGIGAVLKAGDGKTVAEISRYLGVATNNQAEYQAVIAALEKARELGARDLEFYLDSELVVRQLNRQYKVKNAELAPLFLKIHNLSVGFKKLSFRHITRENNQAADRLVNLAIDGKFAM